MAEEKSIREQQSEFEKIYLETVEKQGKFIQKLQDDNLKQRDSFAIEQTINSSNIIMTLNIGIISSTIFLIGLKDNLNTASRILILSLVFNLLSIILEFGYRKIVLRTNINISNERNQIFEDSLNSINNLTSRIPIHNSKSFFEELNQIQINSKNKFLQLFSSLNDLEKKNNWRRYTSEKLMYLGVSGIILIVFIESGLVDLVVNIVINNS